MLRVGTRVYSGAKYYDPDYPGFTPILCLTKSTPYGSLGPYVLKNKEGYFLECVHAYINESNLYNFSKSNDDF